MEEVKNMDMVENTECGCDCGCKYKAKTGPMEDNQSENKTFTLEEVQNVVNQVANNYEARIKELTDQRTNMWAIQRMNWLFQIVSNAKVWSSVTVQKAMRELEDFLFPVEQKEATNEADR